MIQYTKMVQPVEFIVIHHSLTKDGQVVNWQAIKKYHRDMGWTDVGYHFGLDLINNEVEIFVGRPLTATGAHVKEDRVNYRSIGICVIGNYDLEVPSQKHLDKLVPLVSSLLEIFKLDISAVKGHHDFASYKSCPGKLFDLDQLKITLSSYGMK